MSDQAVYDVCLDLFDGIFSVAREQKRFHISKCMSQKIINNIACEPEQFDNKWSFLYNRFGISLN